MRQAVDGEPIPLLPALHGADVALEIGGDLLPGLKTFLTG
jgi:hypothetical protein